HADLEARMICIFGEITPASHLAMIDCLNRLSESDTDVTVYINSQGGNLTSALAIYDMFTHGRYPFKITTVATGQAFSAALIILQGGHERKMFSLDRGDLKYEDEMLQEFEKEICELLTEKTGKKIAAIYKDMAMEKIFTAKEAIDYGLADEII
ncbi:MAG: ATP-dependent Clp protease proteolytic subunit 2, partial [Candidatus Azambacteria bacterium GW2011_GWE2_46_45]